jgi:nicotinate phosphoribosyltransferase
MVSGDLNEYRIRDMVAAGVPIDAFGVGTELATSSDAPNLSAVYKMVEIESGGRVRHTFKDSAEKATMPGAKQVFRHSDYDEVGTAAEDRRGAEGLLRPVILGGSQAGPLPEISEARARCLEEIRRVRPGRRVEHSEALEALADQERRQLKHTPV